MQPLLPQEDCTFCIKLVQKECFDHKNCHTQELILRDNDVSQHFAMLTHSCSQKTPVSEITPFDLEFTQSAASSDDFWLAFLSRLYHAKKLFVATFHLDPSQAFLLNLPYLGRKTPIICIFPESNSL